MDGNITNRIRNVKRIGGNIMGDICGDNRFEIISKAKEDILKRTNISSSEDEMKVLDNFLFRCWQMGWLDMYNEKNKQVMTREDIEQINVVMPYCFESDREEQWFKVGLQYGLDAADTDPDTTSLWHDASEIPQEKNKNITYQTNYHSMYNVHIDFIPTCLRSCKITSRSWDEFVKEVNMRRWAYVNDLLPKGGEKRMTMD